MEIFLIVLAIIFALVGLAGCIVPGLPGPPLNFISLLFIQGAFAPFETSFLVIWGIVTVLVVILDYYIPIWVSKKYGATRQGIIGSIIGLVIGIIFTPIGMIAGLIIGAIVGDMVAGKSLTHALRSGFGSALGTLFSTGFKLIVSGVLTFYVINEIIVHYT